MQATGGPAGLFSGVRAWGCEEARERSLGQARVFPKSGQPPFFASQPPGLQPILRTCEPSAVGADRWTCLSTPIPTPALIPQPSLKGKGKELQPPRGWTTGSLLRRYGGSRRKKEVKSNLQGEREARGRDRGRQRWCGWGGVGLGAVWVGWGEGAWSGRERAGRGRSGKGGSLERAAGNETGLGVGREDERTYREPGQCQRALRGLQPRSPPAPQMNLQPKQNSTLAMSSYPLQPHDTLT